MKQTDIVKTEEITLPLPPKLNEGLALDVYARFMRHVRCVPNSRMTIKVLSAIQFTADLLDHSDAHVAKLLVDHGLRAPRMAFPAEFLRFVDQSLMREDWEIGGPTAAIKELQSYWASSGEDRFAGFRYDYPLRVENAVV